MPENKQRNTSIMGKKDNRIPQKKHNTSVLECENEQIDEKPENELKRITRKDRE